MNRIPRDPAVSTVKRAVRDLADPDPIVRAAAVARFVMWELPAHPAAIVISARRLVNAERLEERIRALRAPDNS